MTCPQLFSLAVAQHLSASVSLVLKRTCMLELFVLTICVGALQWGQEKNRKQQIFKILKK